MGDGILEMEEYMEDKLLIITNVNNTKLVYFDLKVNELFDECKSVIIHDGYNVYPVNHKVSIRENLANIYKSCVPFIAIDIMSEEMKNFGAIYKIVKNGDDNIPFGYYNINGMVLTSDYINWKFYPVEISSSTHIKFSTKFGYVVINGFLCSIYDDNECKETDQTPIEAMDFHLIMKDYNNSKLTDAANKYDNLLRSDKVNPLDTYTYSSEIEKIIAAKKDEILEERDEIC